MLAGKVSDGSAFTSGQVTKSMKPNLIVSIALVLIGAPAAGQRSEFATGRACYTGGKFKEAATHFQQAIRTNPDDAEAYYWMGMSYQVLADIAAPFNGKYISKARASLTKAMELAPGRPDYGRELFDFLLDSAGSSRAARRQAASMLLTLSESDPDYRYMRGRFEEERRANSSVSARLGRLFLAVPRASYRIAELPASALTIRHEPPMSIQR